MRHVDEQHEKMLALARERGVLSLTIDAGRTAPLFSGDRIHLNNAGHAFVAAQVLHMFRALSPSNRQSDDHLQEQRQGPWQLTRARPKSGRTRACAVCRPTAIL